MSLATRCPACGTTFRVVRDQLRISDGWVRCGRCSHVFDGAAELHDPLTAPPALTASLPRPEPTVVPASDAVAASAGIDSFSDALLRLQAGGPPPAHPDPVAPPAWPAPAMPSSAMPVPGAAEDTASEDTIALEEAVPPPSAVEAAVPLAGPGDDGWSRLPSLQLDAAPVASPAADAAADAASVAPDRDEAAEAAADDAHRSLPSALRQSRIAALQAARAAQAARTRPRDDDEAITLALTPSEPVAGEAAGAPVFGIARSFRANPGALPRREPRKGPRLLQALGVVVLMSLLLVQVLYRERNAIVARQPALQPWFASACARLGCELSALRRIADVTIDGASFSRERSGEGYQFSFTLRNRAAVPLAMPAVELSLLDLEERIVVRRVLRPAEYGAPAVLAAHGERATQLPIVLAGEEASSASRVAGFRLDAFYP